MFIATCANISKICDCGNSKFKPLGGRNRSIKLGESIARKELTGQVSLRDFVPLSHVADTLKHLPCLPSARSARRNILDCKFDKEFGWMISYWMLAIWRTLVFIEYTTLNSWHRSCNIFFKLLHFSFCLSFYKFLSVAVKRAAIFAGRQPKQTWCLLSGYMPATQKAPTIHA